MSRHVFQRTFLRAALRLGLILLTIHGMLVTLALLGSDGCARVIVLLDAPFVLGAGAIIGGDRATLPVLVMLIRPLAGTVVYAALGALAYAWMERRTIEPRPAPRRHRWLAHRSVRSAGHRLRRAPL